MPTIRYARTDEASRTLAALDPRMGALIDRVGSVEFTPPDDRFASLVRGIVGQQLSGTAARSIYERLDRDVGVSPAALAGAPDERLLTAGLSRRKAEYVRDLAREVLTGELDLDALDSLSDDEVMAALTKVRGIGPWSAHMFLLFAMGRPDVMPSGDLGIRQSVGRLLGLGRAATPAEVDSEAEAWRPYRSAATFYLYQDAGMGRQAAQPRGAKVDAEDA